MSFNRTSMESNQYGIETCMYALWLCENTFNRTSMESKQTLIACGFDDGEALLIEPVWNRNIPPFPADG